MRKVCRGDPGRVSHIPMNRTRVWPTWAAMNSTLPNPANFRLVHRTGSNGTACDDQWIAPFTGVVFFVLPLAVPFLKRPKGMFIQATCALVGATALMAACSPFYLSLAWICGVVAFAAARVCRWPWANLLALDMIIVAALSLASLVATVWTVTGFALIGDEEERRGLAAAALLAMAGVVHMGSTESTGATATSKPERRGVGALLVCGLAQALVRNDSTGVDLVVAAGLLCAMSSRVPAVPLVPALAVVSLHALRACNLPQKLTSFRRWRR